MNESKTQIINFSVLQVAQNFLRDFCLPVDLQWLVHLHVPSLGTCQRGIQSAYQTVQKKKKEKQNTYDIISQTVLVGKERASLYIIWFFLYRTDNNTYQLLIKKIMIIPINYNNFYFNGINTKLTIAQRIWVNIISLKDLVQVYLNPILDKPDNQKTLKNPLY